MASTSTPGFQLAVQCGRYVWARRLEAGLTLAAIAARVVLSSILGVPVTTLAMAAVTVGLLTYPPTYRWLVERLHGEREVAAWGAVLDAAGFELHARPKVIAQEPTPSGKVVDLELTPACTAEDVEARSASLAIALKAASVRVVPDPMAARRARLVVSIRDPLAGTARPWLWVDAVRTDLWRALPFGVDEDDQLVTLELAGHHLLLGGEPGAGKSNALSLITATGALDPNVELWCFDGKLVELAAWRRCARRFVGADVEAATRVLGELREEMETRYSFLLDHGLRKIEPGMGIGLILVVIDELALYTQSKSKARDELVEMLRDIVARGRAAGIVVVAATQKPAAEVVPTSIRDLFGCRMALRCSTRDASDTVLGAGWAAEGYTASDIDPTQRGIGWLLAEGTVPRRMRCFIMDDGQLWMLARRAEELRGTQP